METSKLNSAATIVKKISIVTFTNILFIACSSDDDKPMPVNEEEIITTVKVSLTPDTGGDTITMESKDLDGDGPNTPIVTVSSNLQANTTYNGSIVLLNETESPAEDITEEVKEEDEDHQFFYTITGAISEVAYTDQDADGNPVGLTFTLTTATASQASFGITLRHEPKKPNDGTLADAGGETDVEQTFSLTVE